MQLTKVVLDTNVVVSAHLKAGGLEAFVLDLALASKLQLYVSPDVLAEYEEVAPTPLPNRLKESYAVSSAY